MCLVVPFYAQPASTTEFVAPQLGVKANLVCPIQQSQVQLLLVFLCPIDRQGFTVAVIAKLDLCPGAAEWTVNAMHQGSRILAIKGGQTMQSRPTLVPVRHGTGAGFVDITCVIESLERKWPEDLVWFFASQ